MKIIRGIVAGIFLLCGVGSIVRGVIVTNKLRDAAIESREQQQRAFDADPLHAPIPDYWTPLPSLYDGPWLPMEFAFLGAFVITIKVKKEPTP